MKKRLVLILSLLCLFCLSACSTKAEMNFEYDKSIMISMTKSIVESFADVPEKQAEYLLSDGEDIEKTAVAGFRQAQTTDQVGKKTGYDTSEDVISFENGAKGDILCSIIVKCENRDVRVTVSFVKNKKYDAWIESDDFKNQYAEQVSMLQQYASSAGFEDVEEFVKSERQFQELGFRTDSAEHFLIDYLCAYNQVYPYTATECEVSAVYSTSELLINGAKNMGVGMGVVFCVLIFIAVIIYLLRFVPKILGKEIKAPGAPKPPANSKNEMQRKAAQIPAGPVAAAQSARTVGKEGASAQAAGEEVTDGELIAVITAALQAYLSTSASTSTSTSTTVHPPAYTASNDKLVVRSIRRVR